MTLKNVENENITYMKIKWIIGYIDAYGAIHYRVVKHGDSLHSHSQIWPGPKHNKWRWLPTEPRHLNTYNEDLPSDGEDAVWALITKLT